MPEMNADEEIAKRFLIGERHKPVFEPDGNRPPDFSAAGSIGIEVRRLNQSFDAQSRVAALEETKIRLRDTVETIVDQVLGADKRNDFVVGMHFWRPLPPWKKLRRLLREGLEEILKPGAPLPAEVSISDSLHLSISRSSVVVGGVRCIGLVMDYDAGGWTLEVYRREIKRCIADKTAKVEPFVTEYQHWWLVLIDHMEGVSDDEVPYLKDNIEKEAPWERIVVLDRGGDSWLDM